VTELPRGDEGAEREGEFCVDLRKKAA